MISSREWMLSIIFSVLNGMIFAVASLITMRRVSERKINAGTTAGRLNAVLPLIPFAILPFFALMFLRDRASHYLGLPERARGDLPLLEIVSMAIVLAVWFGFARLLMPLFRARQ